MTRSSASTNEVDTWQPQVGLDSTAQARDILGSFLLERGDGEVRSHGEGSRQSTGSSLTYLARLLAHRADYLGAGGANFVKHVGRPRSTTGGQPGMLETDNNFHGRNSLSPALKAADNKPTAH